MQKLAIMGGKPVRKKLLPYGRQHVDEQDVQAVVDVLRSDYLTTGPKISEFEQEIAKYVGVKFAVAVSNGTAALHMAAFAAGIGPGDEVLVPALTFAASSNCVLYMGAKPVFVDIDEYTLNIDLADLESKISPKTKAIIPIDFTGQSVDIDQIMAIAKKHNLIVIEDAAHALGSKYKGEPVGLKAHMTMFSFHPVKPITTGEGGIIVTNDETYYHRMLMFRTHGITKIKECMTNYHGPWYYEQQFLGYNYRLTDFQAALGLSQMKKLDSFIQRRQEIANLYRAKLGKLKGISIPKEEGFSSSGWHLYIIQLDLDVIRGTQKEIFEALHAENIGVMVHYLPVYLHPYYRSLGYQKGLCPIAEKVYNRMISLPIFPLMTEADVEDVVKALRKVMTYYYI